MSFLVDLDIFFSWIHVIRNCIFGTAAYGVVKFSLYIKFGLPRLPLTGLKVCGGVVVVGWVVYYTSYHVNQPGLALGWALTKKEVSGQNQT